MIYQSTTVLSLLSAVALVTASPVQLGDDAKPADVGNNLDIRKVVPHIRLKANSWLAVWSLSGDRGAWGGKGGPETYWDFNFHLKTDTDAKYTEEHFNAYIYEPDDDDHSDDAWVNWRRAHFNFKNENGKALPLPDGDVQLLAKKMLDCKIVTEPDADMRGIMGVSTSEPYLTKEGSTHGIMDFSCKEVKVDKQPSAKTKGKA